MMARKPLLALLACLTMACAPALEMTWFERATLPPRNAAEVEVLDSFPLDRSYRSLVRIQASDGGWRESRESLIGQVRARAAAIGANAVVVGETTTTRRRCAFGVVGFGRYDERVVVGTAIVY